MHAVHIEDVSHRFDGAWVLARLQLQIPIGGRVLLTGNNGSGKTTLLRLVSTVLRPTRGRIFLYGVDTQQNPQAARRRLALMTHQHGLYEALSALQNLQLCARLANLFGTTDAAALLARVGLAQHAHVPISGFSAGMKRRLVLARVLLLQPDLVLFDEPFSQLDTSGTALVEDVLDELAAAGTSWIMASHDPKRARRLCNLQLALSEQP